MLAVLVEGVEELTSAEVLDRLADGQRTIHIVRRDLADLCALELIEQHQAEDAGPVTYAVTDEVRARCAASGSLIELVNQTKGSE